MAAVYLLVLLEYLPLKQRKLRINTAKGNEFAFGPSGNFIYKLQLVCRTELPWLQPMVIKINVQHYPAVNFSIMSNHWTDFMRS